MCVCCFHLLFPPQHRHALIQIKHAHTNQYHVLLLLQYKLRIYDTSIPVCTHNERPFFPQSPFLCDHAVSHRLLTMPKPHSIYLLLLIIVTTPPFFISQAHAQPDPYHVAIERRVPRACRPDDARCLALQRDVCDPWNITASDKYVARIHAHTHTHTHLITTVPPPPLQVQMYICPSRPILQRRRQPHQLPRPLLLPQQSPHGHLRNLLAPPPLLHHDGHRRSLSVPLH